MNIKNRIKKLETDILCDTSSNSCECFDKHELAILNQVYGETFNEYDLLPDDTLLTDFCQRCKKTVPERVLKFYRNVEEIYVNKELEKQ